jgi:hypothetical protein
LDVTGQITTRGSIGALVAEPRDGSGAAWSIYNPTGDDLRFFGASDDRMVLTNSGNLGIGTSSPVTKLGVAGNAIFSGATPYISLAYNQSGATPNYWELSAGGVATLANIGTGTNGVWRFVGGAGSEFMRLDSSGNLGIGTSSLASKLVVSNGSNKNLEVQPGATTYLFAYDRTASDYLNLDIGGQILIFSTDNGAERMRLDASGNLGIGTSSPSQKLTVNGSANLAGRGSSFAFMTPDWRMYNTSSGNAFVWDDYTTERMRLDASGNLIVGSTSALTSASGRGNITVNGTDAVLAFGNSNSSAGYIYAASTNLEISAASTRYINFLTNGSERARIDSSGLLTVGNTSPAGSSQITAYGASNGQIAVQNSTNWSRLLQNAGDLYIDNGVGGSTGNTIFRGSSSTIELMRLDSNGNLLIGRTTQWDGEELGITGSASSMRFLYARSTSAGHYLSLGTNGTLPYIEFGNGAGLAFNDGASERARIDSSGNFQVGGTTNYGPGKIAPTFNGTTTNGISLTETTDTDGSAYLAFRNSSGVAVGTVSRNGASAVAYNTSSDYRLKHDIAPMTGALAKVAALRPCTYKWKVDGSDGEGFIAHELAAVVPQCVTGQKDAVDAEGKPVYQGIDTSFLVATLTAAIQEQQAIIEQLKADVAALKGA